MFDHDDTIVAIATPAGRSGIGVVRVAGPAAVRVAAALIGPVDLAPRHATFAKIIDSSNATIVDQVVVTWFKAPHSYTGDDVVELSAHGSPVLLTRIVELAMAAGARLAEPGEFTFRAYLRGRLDLAQAEAVADLIEAVTPLQARAAMDQLEGTLTGAIARIDAALFDLSARLEASLDYPEEGFHFSSAPETALAVARVKADLERLAVDGRAGRVIREGRTVAILGRPNAGKSSLFNALAGASRAIVTDIPGTTRDLLTERIDIHGLAITLVDTAGLRDARDAIEAEGVRRARAAQAVAALNLIVIDGNLKLSPDDKTTPGVVLGVSDNSGGQNRLIVATKSDLPSAWSAGDLGVSQPDVIRVSSLTGAGLDQLRARMASALTDRDDLRDPPAITNARHLSLVEDAHAAITRAETALQDEATEELVLTDITAARRALEEITGRRTTEDLLAHIFARFCLGK